LTSQNISDMHILPNTCGMLEMSGNRNSSQIGSVTRKRN